MRWKQGEEEKKITGKQKSDFGWLCWQGVGGGVVGRWEARISISRHRSVDTGVRSELREQVLSYGRDGGYDGVGCALSAAIFPAIIIKTGATRTWHDGGSL